MNTAQFQSVLHHVSNLSYAQLKKLRHVADKHISNNQVGQVVAEREETVSSCPHCNSTELNRWGMTKQGIQRYRCKSCAKTFNALANTPLYRMRKPEKWLQYTELMWHGTSLRKAAKALGISLRTSFRWRHAFLTSPTQRSATEITGIVEVDETFVKESFKGCRKLPRPARKRGGGHCKQVPIVIALNRSYDISEQVLQRNTKQEIQGFLKPLLTAGSVLCTDGNPSYQGIDKELAIEHKRLIALDNQRVIDGVYHIQTLNNYMMSWKLWLGRFRGVSTKYLHHYLGWYRFMEQQGCSDQAWLRGAV